LIVIATPEGFQTRRIIELARTLQPGIDTAVRTHSEGETAHLERHGSAWRSWASASWPSSASWTIPFNA
jgi:hypothetical protein